MAKVFGEISLSLDGFVAGPRPSLEQPLGEGGERLHEWAFPLAAWREPHGLEGGETGPESDLVAEKLAGIGAVVMGRRMFSGGEGPWESDPNADAWWGDAPPFHVPVFVVTHHARDTVPKQGGTTFTFVTDGVTAAVENARTAAGDRDVQVAGGGSVIQQALSAGALDELMIHLTPVLLGSGTRLFQDQGNRDVRLELADVREGARATHVRYRVEK
jgi:dihydrofolate reductase